MRPSRTAALVLAVPVLVYVAILALVAGLVTHPPLVGWLGLAVVAVLGVALAAGLSALFPRMRANVEPAAAPERERLLVLADARCSGDLLCDTVAARLAGRDAEVLVVAPVLPSPLHYLAGDERAETRDAETRLDAVVTGLRRRGLRAQGRLGSDDPLQSLGDALTGFPAAEALVVTSPAGHWLEPGLFDQARRLVPVLELVEAA